MMKRPTYPIISSIHPAIILDMKPHVRILMPWKTWMINDTAKTPVKTALAGMLGWYRRILASRGHVSRVQLAWGPNVTRPLGSVDMLLILADVMGEEDMKG